MNTMQLDQVRNSEFGIRNAGRSPLRTPHSTPRIFARRLRLWTLAIGLWTLLAHANALEVRTLGGGPNGKSPAKAGFADGNTFLIAKFNTPSDIAVDSDGNLYIADTKNNRLRKVTSPGDDDASLTSTVAARLQAVSGVEVGRSNTIYVVTQGDGKLRKYSSTGTLLETISGLLKPTALALVGDDVFVTELGGAIKKILPDGTKTVVASGFAQPRGITALKNGSLAFTESGNHAIYVINANTGEYKLLAGLNGAGDTDGGTNVAQFNQPYGITEAPNGVLLVADRLNHKVRLVNANGEVSTLYGGPRTTWSRTFPGWRDGDQLTANSREPVGVTVSSNGTVYVLERYWNLIREVTGANLLPGVILTNGGTTNAQFIVTAPTFSPSSGYFPMGGVVTVTSSIPVFFTTDGTEPTTNSRPVELIGNIGTIVFTEHLRDLTSLRLKAFIGTNSSVTVSGRPSPVNEIGISRDVITGIGSTVVLPVVMNLRTNDGVRSLQFRVEITPLNGAPPVSPQFRATTISSNDFIPIVTAAAPNTIGHYTAAPYELGSTRGLVVTAIGTNANFDVKNFAVPAMLIVPIDPSAVEGQSYRVEVLYPSATSDGAQARVSLFAMPPRTITIQNLPYLVGDSSPGFWYGAGEFGDGDLNNNDVNNVFYASLGVRVPFDFTDVFDAMDAYPPEPRGQGDGRIRFLDWQIVLARSLRMDPNNFTRRFSEGGVRVSEPVALDPAPANAPRAKAASTVPGPGTVWLREASIHAISVANVIPGEWCEVPVYVNVAPGYGVGGFSFRAAVVPNAGSPSIGTLNFVPWIGQANFVAGSAVGPNEVLCGWTIVPSPAFSPALQGSNLLGVLRFKMPSSAVYGQSYTVRFTNPNGAADMNTPYDFEGVSAEVWVHGPPQRAPEIISDEWRTNFFKTLGNPEGATANDPDGDGVSNGQEFLDGTSPTDPASRLYLDLANVQTASGPGVKLAWLSASGKLYVLERSANANGPWTTLANGILGDGYVKEFTDVPPLATPFYRIRVQP